MIRRLLWLAALGVLVWTVRNLLSPRRTRRVPARDGPGPREPMVRDRVCNTFLPRSRAVVVRHEGNDLYFCSEACRSTFLDSHRRVS